MADDKMTTIPGLKDDMTIEQKMGFIQALSLYPAVLVMVFVRRRIGFRLIKSNWMVSVALALLVATGIFREQARPFPIIMVLFALALAGYGFWQRYQRWCEIGNGVRWHTYSPGISYLNLIPWPGFMLTYRRIDRFLDPIMCWLIGLLIYALCHLLGALICVCALCLAITENALFERMLKRDLDTLDGLIDAEVQDESVKFYSRAQPEQKRRTLEDTAGIPTGVAPDITKQVELRKAKRVAAQEARPPKPPSPDNLAPDLPEGPA